SLRRPPPCPLFLYTTLFRSRPASSPSDGAGTGPPGAPVLHMAPGGFTKARKGAPGDIPPGAAGKDWVRAGRRGTGAEVTTGRRPLAAARHRTKETHRMAHRHARTAARAALAALGALALAAAPSAVAAEPAPTAGPVPGAAQTLGA